MNNREPMIIIAGQPFQRAVQANLFGNGGTVPAQYNSTDVLTAAINQHGQAVPVFVPTIGWQTTNPKTGLSQTGYTQGQVEVGGTRAQALLLMPSLSFTLLVWRAIVGNSGNPELIARYPIVVSTLTI
jgi:hypothetical protein